MLEPTFKSNRIVVRPITEKDFYDLYLGINNDVVNKYAINNKCSSESDVASWYRNSYHNGHHWVITESNSIHLVGCISLEFLESPMMMELGCWLLPDYHSKGYMTESLITILHWLGNVKPGIEIFAIVAKSNITSDRLAHRLGFTFLKDSCYSKEDNSISFPSRIYYKKLFSI